MINHVTVIGLLHELATTNHVIDVILYDKMADHPLMSGGSKAKIASPFVPAASIFCGTHGTVTGITSFEGRLSNHVARLVLAVTVNVYVTPFVSHATVIGLHAPVTVIFHGDDFTI